MPNQRGDWDNLDGYKNTRHAGKIRFRRDSYRGKGRPKEEDYIDIKKFVGPNFVSYKVDENARDTSAE